MKLDPNDLHISTYPEHPKGAWSNKPDVGIRISHIPTGIVATCATERSQHANRAIAMAKIKNRIDEYQSQLKAATLDLPERILGGIVNNLSLYQIATSIVKHYPNITLMEFRAIYDAQKAHYDQAMLEYYGDGL